MSNVLFDSPGPRARARYRIYAAVGAIVFETVGTLLGSAARTRRRLRPLQGLDSAGGLVLGAISGLFIVWVLVLAIWLLRARPAIAAAEPTTPASTAV